MNRRAQTVACTSARSSGRLLHSRRLDKTSINLGMGLAICRTILKGSGGSITCRNRPERGAAFYVQLPLAT
jgi:signal transduction histidine kinase